MKDKNLTHEPTLEVQKCLMFEHTYYKALTVYWDNNKAFITDIYLNKNIKWVTPETIEISCEIRDTGIDIYSQE